MDLAAEAIEFAMVQPQLESFVFESMAQTRLPGLSIALVQDGEIVYARGFGQRDLHNGYPATPETLYSVGSITKSFTALAIMQLAEQGLIDPGDPVERFLPFPLRPMGEKVTVQHLLTHTIGVPALAYSEALISHANGTGGRWLPIAGPQDVLTFMSGAQEWEESPPGQRWAYANEGYAILGLLVEQLSGKPYGEYLAQRVLEPLGMTRTFLDRRDVEAQHDVAVPYVLTEGGEARPGHYLYRKIRSEGGLVSSVTDLARYLSVYLGDKSEIIGNESIRLMMEPRVEVPYLSVPGLLGVQGDPEHVQHYGYGLMTEEFLGRKLVGHGGSVLVSTAHLAFLPSEGMGVAVLANGSGYSMAHIARAALAVALGHELTELPAIRVQSALARLTGHYRSFKGTMQATVERRGDFLELRFVDSASTTGIILVPEQLHGSEPRFFTLSDGRRLPLFFRLLENGVELLYERHKLRRVGPL